jgi:RNA polymerase sigma factor (sigma-70 family)
VIVENNDEFCGLMRRIGEGSEEAAWELVTLYGEEIRRAVRRFLSTRLRPKFDSLDFVQLVWQSFFRVRGKCDRFHRPEELVAYLVTMTRNKVGMEARRRLATEKYDVRREQHFDLDEAPEIVSREPAPIDIAICHEQWEQMLEGQPEHYRQIIQLRLEGHTCQEIGRTVNVTERTVRRFLKKLLHATPV